MRNFLQFLQLRENEQMGNIIFFGIGATILIGVAVGGYFLYKHIQGLSGNGTDGDGG